MIRYQEKAPDAKKFAQFRAECGWGIISEKQALVALSNSLYFVSAFHEEALVGFARVLGDGALNYYIQDIIVQPLYRHKGIGSCLLKKLLLQIKQAHDQGGATVGLMSAKGKECFYERFGFIQRPNAEFGPGMVLALP